LLGWTKWINDCKSFKIRQMSIAGI